MDYIIFMATIQLPFLYVIWKFFNQQLIRNEDSVNLLKKQNEHIARFMDTLKMSLERISEDLYGKGKINTRFFEIERNYKELQKKFSDMEFYTGLNSGEVKKEPVPMSEDVSEKDFV